MTDNRHPDQIRYPRAGAPLGVEADKFPEIVPCTAVLGPLLPEVAEGLGLSPDVQVVAGAIDNTAAAIGSGAAADYATHLYIGTLILDGGARPFKENRHRLRTGHVGALRRPPAVSASPLARPPPAADLTFPARQHAPYHARRAPGPKSNSPTSSRSLDPDRGARAARQQRPDLHPWIWGERAPVDDRSLRAGLYNLSLNNTRADIMRAFLEGVAFNARWLLAPVEKFLGRKVQAIHIVGGGRSRLCGARSSRMCWTWKSMVGPSRPAQHGAATMASPQRAGRSLRCRCARPG